MNTKGMSSCAMLGCIHVLDVERHFFRFPKEHDRWLKWVQACKRFDLLNKGPEYSYRNIRLCHLHFEKKLYKIHKFRAHLHPDAIPTQLLGPDPYQQDNTNEITEQSVSSEKELHNSNTCAEEAIKVKEENINICAEVAIKVEEENSNICVEEAVKVEEENSNICVEETVKVEEENSNADPLEIILPTCHSAASNLEMEVMKPGTSAEEPGTSLVTTHTKKLLDNSHRKSKLHQRINKLKAQSRKLRETIRRLRMREKIYKIIYKIILK